MAEKPKPRNRVLFRLIKGFIYGNVFGLIFGVSIYLLATAVNAITTSIPPGIPLPVPPTTFMLLIYGASVVTGTVTEYSHWLEEQE